MPPRSSFKSEALVCPASELLTADSSQLKPFSRNHLQPKEAASAMVILSPLGPHLSKVRREHKNPLLISICDQCKQHPRSSTVSLGCAARSCPDRCCYSSITSYTDICVLECVSRGICNRPQTPCCRDLKHAQHSLQICPFFNLDLYSDGVCGLDCNPTSLILPE